MAAARTPVGYADPKLQHFARDLREYGNHEVAVSPTNPASELLVEMASCNHPQPFLTTY